MYHSQETILSEGKSRKYIIHQQEQQLSYLDFLTLLQQDEQFRSFFINLLAVVPFHSYQWETPPVTSSTVDQPFEFVIYNSPGIDLPPDPGPFHQYFNNSHSIAEFNNLGNNARLIAPAPIEEGLNYSHIGVFTNAAPIQQQHSLWEIVGRTTENLLKDKPLWLNTAGGGVAWLHVRLDSRPKYYQHRPYLSFDDKT